MSNELTNLLPRERRNALRHRYFLRLGVVGALFLTALTVAAAALLLPTYVFLEGSIRAKETQLTTINAAPKEVDEATLFTRLASLSSNAATLSALSSTPSVSTIIRSVLAIPHPGVALSRLEYTPPLPGPGALANKNTRTLLIGGTATTRDALRTYQLALQADPLSLSADLPVSAYAKDTSIPFTITVTLAP